MVDSKTYAVTCHIYIYSYMYILGRACKTANCLSVGNFQATTRSSPLCSWSASLPLLAPPPLRQFHGFDRPEAKGSGPFLWTKNGKYRELTGKKMVSTYK